jgi:ABC-type antimicrobial peptide transport system permease subunit
MNQNNLDHKTSKKTPFLMSNEGFQGYTYTNDVLSGTSNIDNVILDQQVAPLERTVKVQEENIDKINKKHFEINDKIDKITNEYGDGLQDELQNDPKYQYEEQLGHKYIGNTKEVRVQELDAMVRNNEQVLFFASVAGVSLLIGMIMMRMN